MNRRTRGALLGTALLALLALSDCGGGSSGPSSNPVPAITALSPNTATREGPAFTLTITGSGFVMGSVVEWNGTALPTTFVSGTELTAQVAATDIIVAGTDNVTVVSPAPGGGTSEAAQFNIPCVLAAPTAASTQTRARLGAYYFDGWAGPLTEFHFNGLVSSSYQGREPLSGWRDDNACAVEQQLAWAHAFGLSFFVFDWYFNGSVIEPTDDLNSAFKITRSLPDRHGMQYAILYVNQGPFKITNSADWTASVTEWVGYMKDADYVRVNGKPLFIVIDLYAMRETFGSSATVQAKLSELRAVAQTQGLPGVTVVGGMFIPDGAPTQDGLFPDLSMAVADSYDAVTVYSYAYSVPLTAAGAQPFSVLADTGRWSWAQSARKSPLPVIPVVVDGDDKRPGSANCEVGRSLYWFSRSPPEFASFLNDGISWAEANPQLRVEPSPAPPVVLLEAWNELGEGSYLVPTVDDGTSYGDSMGVVLTTQPVQVRSVLTLADSGPADPNRSLSGRLVEASGAPIVGATVALTETPAKGAATTYQLSGQVPTGAVSGTVALRVNVPDRLTLWPGFFYAGPGTSDLSVYQVSFKQADGVERVVNGDFSGGAQAWSLKGQTQIVPSDRGAGQMAQIVASANQLATLDSQLFPVLAGGPFGLSITARIATAALDSGNFVVAFQDASGSFLKIPAPSAAALPAESIPFAAAMLPLGSATTDASGSFRLSIATLSGAALTANAGYAGDSRHWPAVAHSGP
jgi:Glycosyltransferase WbsX/IPT/TIG domain